MAKTAPVARTVRDVDPLQLADLNAGRVASRTLTEGLAVDFAQLMSAAVPECSPADLARMQAQAGQGITRRMALAAGILAPDDARLAAMQAHPSDTVRGWACYAIAARPMAGLDAYLTAIRPLADDPHFGVREWAWLALRPHLATDIDGAVARLAGWVMSPSERLRRFACEAIRPRGVWCSHIPDLVQAPERALPVLAPLRDDPSRYVQDSVGNWLNDAAKAQPDWVRGLCARWLAEGESEARRYICKRAQRSL